MQKNRKSTYSQSARHSQPAVTGIFGVSYTHRSCGA